MAMYVFLLWTVGFEKRMNGANTSNGRAKFDLVGALSSNIDVRRVFEGIPYDALTARRKRASRRSFGRDRTFRRHYKIQFYSNK